MTYEEKKAYLEQYIPSLQKRELLTEQFKELKAHSEQIEMFSLGADSNSAIKRAQKRLDALAAQIAEEIEQGISLRTQIKMAIARIENKKQRNVLMLHYVSGMTYEEVADKMCYSTRQIFILYKRGMEALNPTPVEPEDGTGR